MPVPLSVLTMFRATSEREPCRTGERNDRAALVRAPYCKGASTRILELGGVSGGTESMVDGRKGGRETFATVMTAPPTLSLILALEQARPQATTTRPGQRRTTVRSTAGKKLQPHPSSARVCKRVFPGLSYADGLVLCSSPIKE